MSWRRRLYGVLLVLLTPMVMLRLLWRARRQREYLRHWGERFGFFSEQMPPGAIWLHAVSVGETRALAPLLKLLREARPRAPILLTHMTPTGRETARALYGDTVRSCYLPYDHAAAVRRFLRHFRPALGLLLETELWPNLLAEVRAAGIPLLLVNARLSARSARGYARFPALSAELLGSLAGIAAQSEADAQRFRALGASAVRVTGNLKFDVAIAAGQIARGQTLRRLFGRRSVLLAASTREGEESLLLELCLALRVAFADLLLVIVPRHPQRFDQVAALLSAADVAFARISAGHAVEAACPVVLGDSMGEMLAYYASADLAVMGGSILDFGSQNLIEACAAGCPVVLGRSVYNFAEAASKAVAAGAARQVADYGLLPGLLAELLADPAKRARMGEAGKRMVAENVGAAARTRSWLERWLPAPEPAALATASTSNVKDGLAAPRRP